MNKVILLGRLTRDPESKGSNSEKQVCRFTVACDRPRQKGQEKSDADFLPCVAFGKTAELILKFFKKGSKILITDGTIRTGQYVSTKTNQTVYTTDVWVNGFEFCESRKEAQANTQQSSGNSYGGTKMGFDDVDLPF